MQRDLELSPRVMRHGPAAEAVSTVLEHRTDAGRTRPPSSNAWPDSPPDKLEAVKWHVLMIGDDPDSELTVRRNLGILGSGFSLETARSLPAALRLALPSPPDVVLADLRLDEVSGTSIVESVREQLPGTAIVVVTGEDHADTEWSAISAGSHEFIRRDELGSRLLPRVIGFAIERERMRKLEDHLEASLRLATMGQVAASVAHEVNNPAAYVMANLELLTKHLARTRSERDVEAEELLGAALDGIKRIGGIVRELKNLSSSRSEDTTELVDINEAVEAACAMVGAGARRRATLELKLGEVPSVEGSRGKLVQLVTNLVINAFEACPGSDHLVRVQTRARGGQVLLQVEDDGLGIPEEVRPRMFEPFFTTRSVDGGTGLGLGICRRIVEEHRGTITIESQEGVGTSFTVALPSNANLRHPARGGSRLNRAAVGRLRLLIVDDEPALRMVYRRMFSAHDIVVAKDGIEALAAMDEGPDFDAILCDLSMPRMDGIEFYEVLGVRHPGHLQRVAFCTGGATDERTRSFLERVSTVVLEKPVSLRKVLAAVEGLGSRSRHNRDAQRYPEDPVPERSSTSKAP